MVRITKVYTKKGDKGMTQLAGGQKISKTSPRIEAYGGVDELNSALGFAAEGLREQAVLSRLKARIHRIQKELFDLGAQLSVLAKDRRKDTPVIKEGDIQKLENEIDEMNKILPHLTSFILPGGGEVSARLHLARTICRRVERETLKLSEKESLDGTELPYLNRLSDWLFVAARYAAQAMGVEETLWKEE